MRLRPALGLTKRRLIAHGAILAACLWSIYLWTLATPGFLDREGNLKGTDFLHFYTLGALALDHRGADLYDINAQAALAAQRVPQAGGIRYLPLYPPQVSLLFAPLAHFPYGWALLLWWLCSAAIYGSCCYAVWRACPNLRSHGSLVFLLAIAYPAFFHLIAWGQTSALALACFTLMFFALRSGRDFLAGIAFGCLIFKPQMAIAGLVLFVGLGAWKLLAGAALSAALQLDTGIFYYGLGPLRRWIDALRNLSQVVPWLEPRPYQTHSLRSFWDFILPPHISFGVYVLSALIVMALTIACWRHHKCEPLALRYSALLFATVLVAPHLTVYDLVILAPAFLLLADWLVAQPQSVFTDWLGILLYLPYALPLLGPFARWTHLQLSVIAMSAVLYLIWKLSKTTHPVLAPERTLR